MFKKISIESVEQSCVTKGLSKYAQAVAIGAAVTVSSKIAKRLGAGDFGQAASGVAGGIAYCTMLAKLEKI